MNNNLCPYCRLPMGVVHGNSRYHKECAKEVKKRRSIKQYAKQNLQLDPYWLNEKILRELYHTYGDQFEIDSLFLKQRGFSFRQFKGERLIKGITYCIMHQYGFSINQNKKIILCKL